MSFGVRFVSVVVVIAFILSVALAGCGGSATPTPTKSAGAATTAPGAQVKVSIAIGGDPTTLDPQAADDGNERTVNDNVYETLLTRDQDMKIVPGLAESYKQTEPAVWEVKMRDGVKFHNGEPCDATAAAYSINRIIDTKFNSEQRSYFETITKATAVDAKTVKIETNGPDPILPARLYWLKIVPPKYFAGSPSDITNKPVGTGPYKFVEWQRGNRIVLTINNEYWGTKPQVTDVTILPRAEPTTRLAALKAGEVDLVRNLLPEQIDQAPQVAHVAGLEFPFFRINAMGSKLSDARIRQAMNYAVDKETLIKSIYGGYAVLAEGQLIGPMHFGYNPNIKAYPFDLAKAQSLLKEVSSTPIEINLVGESGRWLKDKEIIEAVAAMWTKAGMKVNIKIEEWTRYLDQLFATDNPPDVIFVSNDNSLLDADRTLSAYYLSGGRVGTYKNAQVDKLITDARTETDTAKRLQMYNDALKISRDEGALVWLVNVEDIYGMTKRLDWKPPLDGRILVKNMKIK